MINKTKLLTSVIALALIGVLSNIALAQEEEDFINLSVPELRDKIKGAWAAQTIGVTYGHPVEFRFNGVRVPPEREIPWYESYLLETFTEREFVYDDIYMDLTFVQVYEDEGKRTNLLNMAASSPSLSKKMIKNSCPCRPKLYVLLL